MKRLWSVLGAVLVAGTVGAQEVVTGAGSTPAEIVFRVDNLWIMIAAMLVFMMNLGFATVESGLARAKNCTNILFKNLLVPCIGLLTYALCGFALMYPGEANWLLGRVIGFAGWGVSEPGTTNLMLHNGAYTYWTDFLFQGMFAATAATIVSGAVAERVKLNSFLLFTCLYAAVVYPLIGSWGWGGGWLQQMGFHDLAGSAFVHTVGGAGALAGVLLLGPRIGKYDASGRPLAIPGHSMPLATIGVFLLWFGWFGFNGGSVFSADPRGVSYVLVTTSLGACTGTVCAMLMSQLLLGKPDLSMTLNGCLVGLVAITAGADCVSIPAALAIGALGGAMVVPAVMMFDRLGLDDPVGALSVHLCGGILGTLAVGVFSPEYAFTTQLLGIAVVFAAAFACALALFALLKVTLGIRVSEAEELRGLDLGEHNNEAYAGFQIFTNQ